MSIPFNIDTEQAMQLMHESPTFRKIYAEKMGPNPVISKDDIMRALCTVGLSKGNRLQSIKSVRNYPFSSAYILAMKLYFEYASDMNNDPKKVSMPACRRMVDEFWYWLDKNGRKMYPVLSDFCDCFED